MRILPCLLMALCAAVAFAQDDELPPDGPGEERAPADAEATAEKSEAEKAADDEARSLLAAALRVHKTSEHLFASVAVKHEPPEQLGNGAVQVAFMAGMVTGQPFEGEAEGWYAPDGVAVITSKAPLPGFALYVRDGRSIKEVVYEDKAPSLAQLEAELGPLLDPARIVRKLFDADLTHMRNAETGDITFTGEVPREIVKVVVPAPGQMMFPGANPRVLKAAATLVVSKEGRFKSIKVSVTRNDPMAEAMRNRGQFRVVIQNGKRVPQKQKDDDEKHDIEGGTTHYTLTFDRDGPSERAQTFKKRVSQLLE